VASSILLIFLRINEHTAGVAENAGRENDGREIDGPICRA